MYYHHPRKTFKTNNPSKHERRLNDIEQAYQKYKGLERKALKNLLLAARKSNYGWWNPSLSNFLRRASKDSQLLDDCEYLPISAEDLPKLAKWCMDRPLSWEQMDEDVIKWIQGVVRLRKKVTKYYDGLYQTDRRIEATEKHNYWREHLEKALEILEKGAN